MKKKNPRIILRRSPRFICEYPTCEENPTTPEPAASKIHTPHSFSPSLRCLITKTQKIPAEKPQKGGRKELRDLTKSSEGCRRSARLEKGANLSSLDLQKQCVTEKRAARSSFRRSTFVNNQYNEISQKGDRKVAELNSYEKFVNGSRTSARLDGGANLRKKKEAFDSQKQSVVEKRVTRSSVRRNKYEDNEVDNSNSEEDSSERARICPREGNAKAGFDSRKQNINNIEKRITRSSTQTNNIRKTSNVSNDSVSVLDGRKPNGNDELSEVYISKRDIRNCGIKTRIGEKRKRYQAQECESVQGWTTEQELALQRAYFTAKPTPHFWKKVAKMVPGKSADECFNRIHSDHLTPTQPRTRSRAKRKEPSPLSFSASKLLSPIEIKTKKLRNHQRALLAQKTVRKLLEKQQNKDQDYEADFFAALEPTVVVPCCLDFPEIAAFASPPPRRCKEMSSPAHKKQLSRLSSTQKAAFVSPPVLKQIKNKALHEKYIDQLHCRDAKRKTKSLRNYANKIDEKANCTKVTSAKVAKDALVFNAQDAISQYRNLQSSTEFNINDDDDDDNASRDDEGEDEDELC